ncbi:SRPBCC family protein [Streptosporangium sp. KLBMP 9127]|nr:SRPBCC family protein [Streptosporangium sp. KLBMP 9127]
MAMRFEHEFTVPVPVEQAWATLLDVERVAPCLPGAALDSVTDEEIAGRMKVKVGPITVTYRGTAVFQDVDKDSRSVTVKATGKEARGSGTASATVTARLRPEGDTTKVTVETTFNVTGRPAQFGRGVMAEVGTKLIDRFAVNLSALLSSEPEETGEPKETAETGEAGGIGETGSPPAQEPARPAATTPKPGSRSAETRPAGTARTSRTPDEEALDLLEIAGAPLFRRLAPVAAALLGLLLAGWLIRKLVRRR